MTTTLTISNLDDSVKQLLRMQAAIHGRSIEAEAREILSIAVKPSAATPANTSAPNALKTNAAANAESACHLVRGIWKGRMTTDEAMRLTRGGD